jgi:hypothetical protein
MSVTSRSSNNEGRSKSANTKNPGGPKMTDNSR